MTMRKTMLLLAALVVALPLCAQRPRARVEWGLLGGVNLSTWTTPDDGISIRSRLGWQLGMTTAVRWGMFAVEPQILYVRQGLVVRRPEEASLTVRSNAIDVPVLASVRFLNRIKLYAGPVLTVMNSCKSTQASSPYDFGRIRPTLSYTAGANVRLLRRLAVDLRYNGSFGSKRGIVLPDGSELGRLRNSGVSIGVGYIF